MSIDARALSEFTDQWVFSNQAPSEGWWPVGPIEHQLADGSMLTGILVFAVVADHGAHTFRLRVVSHGAPVWTVRAHELSGRPEDSGHAEDTPWMRAWKLAQAIVNGDGVRIAYQGKKDPAPQDRRLDALIPTKDGQGVFAHDIDKGAPRQFRLDRITTFHTAFLSHRKLNEAVASVPEPRTAKAPSPFCYGGDECIGLSSCPRSPSCSS